MVTTLINKVYNEMEKDSELKKVEVDVMNLDDTIAATMVIDEISINFNKPGDVKITFAEFKDILNHSYGVEFHHYFN